MEWSSDEVAKVLNELGFTLARRESHDTYVKKDHARTVSVPRNSRSITRGTLGAIWRQAGITAAKAREIRERPR